LLGPDILAEHLNDDVFGRTLDLIYAYGPEDNMVSKNGSLRFLVIMFAGRYS